MASITRTANPAGVSASANVATYSSVDIGAEAPNRIIAVVVGSELASTPINGVTIDSGGGDTAMTAGTQGNQGAVYARTFYLLVPTGTTATIKVTFGTNSPTSTQNHIAVYRILDATYTSTGADQSTDMDATDPLTTGSTTIGTGGVMLAVAARAGGTGGQDTWSNLTEDLDVDGGAFGFTTATSATAGTATRTCAATTDGEDGALSWLIFADNTAPTVALNSPADASSDSDTTPTLDFTGTDADGNDIRYTLQIYQPVATDDFNRADVSSAGMNLGANWTASVPNYDLGISSNQAYQTVNTSDNVAFNNAVLANNQYVQAKMAVATTASSGMGVVIRASATDYVMFQQQQSANQCFVYWYNGGAYTQIGSTYSGKFANNDVIRLEAIGTTINAYINGVLVITGTNASIPASGKAGILLDENGDRIDDFECGDIILNKVSGTDSGFANPDNGGDTDPFTSGENIQFTVQAGDALAADTYYWMVRGIDPSGSNGYGSWSSARSFTITTDTTTPQTITGVARIEKSVAQTVTGKARIEKTSSQTVTGVARIQKTVTQVITGLARITATTLQTITGKARIEATTTQNITGKASILRSVDQTISGIASIVNTIAQTITGKARITATSTQTITGKGSILKTVTQVITGLARIQKSVAQTVSGLARITVSTAQTITGQSRITATTTRTLTGLARITQIVLQTITGKARIQKSVAQTVQGTGRVEKSVAQTTTGKSRITAVVGQVLTAVSRITQTTLQTITGKGRIQQSVLQTISGVASVIIGVTATSQTISGRAKIKKARWYNLSAAGWYTKVSSLWQTSIRSAWETPNTIGWHIANDVDWYEDQ